MADKQAKGVPEGILSDPADSVENGRGDPADRDLGARGQASLEQVHERYKKLVADYKSDIKKLETMIAEWAANPATKPEEVCEVNSEFARLQKNLEENELAELHKNFEKYKLEIEQDEATLKEGENEVAPRDSK